MAGGFEATPWRSPMDQELDTVGQIADTFRQKFPNWQPGQRASDMVEDRRPEAIRAAMGHNWARPIAPQNQLEQLQFKTLPEHANAPSLESQTPFLQKAHSAVDAAGRALAYPWRVLERAAPNFSAWMFPEVAESKADNRMGEWELADHLQPALDGINKLGTYTPGQRQSDMVEDRRPTSIWSYYEGDLPGQRIGPLDRIQMGGFEGE
jgi:hypothetical protein